MENEVLKDIIEYAKKSLMAKYGYCGIAENDKGAFLNSDDGEGKDIKITIKYQDE